MLPELGQIALILALLIAALQAALPLVGAQRGIAPWMAVARPAAYAQLLLVAFAFAILSYGFVSQDFTLKYVAQNSNSLLPMVYRYTAVWGSHEGSLLLWVLVLASWTAVVARSSRRLPPEVAARVLSVMGVLCLG
ncbi:MAG: heme lyase CcmF/NrfE family subunit, partial [Lysobacter sp.]